MNKLPRAFCITLRETPERREEAEKTFSSAKISVEFFEGIHGKSFGLETAIPNLEELPGREYHITTGHCGCIMSHFILWKILQTQPEEEFLVFEDDIQFEPDFEQKLLEYCKELPNDWQFVYVGWLPVHRQEPVMITEHVASYKPFGTHAYMVKKSALPVLIETNKVLWHHIDIQIRDRSLPLLNNYTLVPSLVGQKSVFNIDEPVWYSLCYDWEEDPHLVKREKKSNMLYYGKGWHPLERNNNGYFVWSDGRSELILNGEWKTLEAEIIVEGGVDKEPGKVISPHKMDTRIFFNEGKNRITVDVTDRQSIIFETKTFCPAEAFKSSDTRNLGARFLNGFSLTGMDDTKHFVPLCSMERGDKISEEAYLDQYENFRTTPKVENPKGKLNLRNQLVFAHHRSGWAYAIKLLEEEHRNDGIKFDGFLDNTFGTSREQNSRIRNIPYREDWVGVFHNPPMTPTFFSDVGNPSSMIMSAPFQESLSMCRGLYVLSNYHAKFLREMIGNVPINVIYHPTEDVDVKFDLTKFIENKNKKIINIGWWLRKVSSIFRLNVDPSMYEKIRIVPNKINRANLVIERIFSMEKGWSDPTTDEQVKSVTTMRHTPPKDYDDMLSENIVFVELYDASANNVVIDCMARNTPLLINPLPAVIEYLGADYPFYFKDLNDASEKAHNMELIEKTHNYLVNWEGKQLISKDYFLHTFRNSEIYKSI